MANVKFFSGQENNLDNLAKKAGQVLLALNSNEGSLYYDIDSNTRIKLNAKNADASDTSSTNFSTSPYGRNTDTIEGLNISESVIAKYI